MELTTLNQQRKQLIQEVSMLKNYRDFCINQSMQRVSELRIDFGETFFSLDGEFINKSFTERFDSCMKALTKDVYEVEDTLGVRLDDLDAEMDHVFNKMAEKENEYEILEKELKKPLKEKKEYKETMDNFVKEMIDLSNPVDYVELQEVIDRKELFDNLLQEIIQERERQLQEEIIRIQSDHLSNRINQKIVYCNMESHASTVQNSLKNKHTENWEKIHLEKEKLFEQFRHEETDRNKRFLLKYKNLYESQSQEDEDDASSNHTMFQSSWKFDLMRSHDELIEKEREFREDQTRRDQVLIQYLNKRENNPHLPHPSFAVPSSFHQNNKQLLNSLQQQQQLQQQQHQLLPHHQGISTSASGVEI